jgi:hypothetical protein
MPRVLLACAVFALFPLPGLAGEATTTSETLIRISTTPEPAPRPALRYLLLPELREMNPGNPVHNYLKCFTEQQRFFFDKEAFDRREGLLAMPLTELAGQGLEEYRGYVLSQADRAARLDTPDWQILTKLKAEGIYLLLPDVQQLRSLNRALAVRFRAEVASRRFDDAIRTAKTMFAMSRHLNEHPTFIGNLVGIAIASVAIVPLEEMLEQPGCPNLYWALTNLPAPLVDLRKGAQGERMTVDWVFRDLDSRSPMSAEQLEKLIAGLDPIIGAEKPSESWKGLRAWLDARAKQDGVLDAARRRLIESGLAKEAVPRFLADQVILLDEKRACEILFDDLMKLVGLPTWQGEALAPRVKENREPALFADLLIPALHNVFHAKGRLEQRIALLRCVEAVRLHAAEHDGAAPAKLSELSVPVPDDPFTGKPFRYECTGDTAHLRGTPPKGMENVPAFNPHYEVTFAR